MSVGQGPSKAHRELSQGRIIKAHAVAHPRRFALI